jgi:ABC-type bacteriocin/lantibiotic exporter with double-glycine peptidase domain
MPGEKVGVIGKSGSGKSSFIKLFLLQLFPSEGTVLIDN